MADSDGSIFERDFETAVAMPIGGGTWTWNSNGSHLACALSQRSGGHSVFFTCVGPFHYYTRGKDSCMENLTHAQTVCTRSFPLLLLKGPGDEAKNPHAWGVSQVDPDLTSTCHVVTLPSTDGRI